MRVELVYVPMAARHKHFDKRPSRAPLRTDYKPRVGERALVKKTCIEKSGGLSVCSNTE